MGLPLRDQCVLWNSPSLVTQHSRSGTLQPFSTAFGAGHPECSLNMLPCSSWSLTCVHWKILNKQTNKQKSTEPTAVTALIQIVFLVWTLQETHLVKRVILSSVVLKINTPVSPQGSKTMGKAGNVIWSDIFHKQHTTVLEIAIHLKHWIASYVTLLPYYNQGAMVLW